MNCLVGQPPREDLKEEDGSYQCKTCNERFKENETDKLDTHLSSKCCQKGGSLLINNYGRFQCKECETSYKEEFSLRKHIIWKHSRSEAFSFKCDKCEKQFAKNSSMQRHMKTAHE